MASKVWAITSFELCKPVWGFLLSAEERLCYQYCQKIGALCCPGIENIVHLKISKSVWALSISQKNYWLVARKILHFNFLQLKLFLFKLSFFLFQKTHLHHRRKFHMSGSCVQVQKETGVRSILRSWKQILYFSGAVDDKFTWHLRYYLFHTYVPTCLIVIMSWISFWIKPEVTLFRNMSNGQKLSTK